MTQRPKDIGTAAETAVVRHLRKSGFPNAERRALTGAHDQGDVTGTAGICWEVKGGKAAKTASDGQVAAWLAETDTERVNARADIGVLVMARAGIGPDNAGRWWAILHFANVNAGVGLASQQLFTAPVRMHLADAVLLLRAFGYGDSLEPEHEQGDIPDDGRDDDPWDGSLRPVHTYMHEGQEYGTYEFRVDDTNHSDAGTDAETDPPQPFTEPCPGPCHCTLHAVNDHAHWVHP